MQIAREIQSTKSARKCGYFRVKILSIKETGRLAVGVLKLFSAVTMSDFTIATEIIRKRKMNRYCAWINELESYSSFNRKLLIKWCIEGKIDLSDIDLDCAEVNF